MSIIGSLITGKMLGIGLAAAVAATAVCSLLAYNKGVASDKQRSDLVIANMVIKADADLAAANTIIRAQGAQLQATKEAAEHDLQTERDIAAQWVTDAVAAERVRRTQIATFAGGPGAAGDTLAACRGEARALGDVLEAALLAHRVCSGHAEAEASGARAVLAGWPRRPVATAPAPN